MSRRESVLREAFRARSECGGRIGGAVGLGCGTPRRGAARSSENGRAGRRCVITSRRMISSTRSKPRGLKHSVSGQAARCPWPSRCGALVLWLLLADGTAYAAEPVVAVPASLQADSNDRQREAESHVRQAGSFYKAGQYLEAASELNVAYTLQPEPVYLFNIAQAYRKAARARAAQVMYARFVETAPTHPLVPEARGYLQDMDALAKAQAQEQAMRDALGREQARNRPLWKRAWFWGLLGGVLGATAIGVGLGVGLSRREPSTDGGFIDLRAGSTF